MLVGQARRTQGAAATRPRVGHVRFSSLPTARAHHLFEALGEVMATAVEHAGGGDWAEVDWERRRGHVLAEADAYVAWAGGRPVGFLAYRVVPLDGRPCVHLLSAYILPEHQGKGLGFTLNARLVFRMLARRPLRQYYMAADLLNPIALSGWRSRISRSANLYPALSEDPAAAPSPGLVRAAARFAAERYPSCGFDPASGVLRGKTLPRSGPVPASGDPDVDRLFEQVVPERGDTVLMLVDGSHRLVVAEVGEMVRALPRALRPRTRSGA